MTARTPETDATKRRLWKRGERSKVSVMHVFRAAHYARDSRVESGRTDTGDIEISQRSKQRRDGMDESSLKAHLQAELSALINTINLEAAVSLEDAPHIRASVLNYGFRDLSDVTVQELNSSVVVQSLRQSLINHEPRLIPASIEVVIHDGRERNGRRLSLSIKAELMGDPIDIPISFDADVDLGAGKMELNGLKVSQ